MVRKAALAIVLFVMILSGCDLSTALGGSTTLKNNSDSEVTAVIKGSENAPITIPPRSGSGLVSIGRENLTNGNISIELDGLFYSEKERNYRFSDSITLNPDCLWLAVENTSGTKIENLEVDEMLAENQPRQAIDIDSPFIKEIPDGGTFYIMLNSTTPFSLSFSASSNNYKVTYRDSLELGIETNLQLIMNTDSEFALV